MPKGINAESTQLSLDGIFEVNNHFAQSAGAVEYTDLHLCRGVRPPPNECPGYDTKQSDGEVPAVL